VGVRVGLAEDLRVLDIIEGGGGGLAVLHFEPDCLEGTLAQVDAPHTGYVRCHGVTLRQDQKPSVNGIWEWIALGYRRNGAERPRANTRLTRFWWLVNSRADKFGRFFANSRWFDRAHRGAIVPR